MRSGDIVGRVCSSSRRVRAYSRNEQDGQNIPKARVIFDDNQTFGRNENVVGMRNGKRTSISHVNSKWQKGNCFDPLS